jgi:hypothetical protein
MQDNRMPQGSAYGDETYEEEYEGDDKYDENGMLKNQLLRDIEYTEAHAHLPKPPIHFFLEDDKEPRWSPPEGLKPGQVVRLKKQSGQAFPGSIGIIVYYYSAERFGPGTCQVVFYDDPYEPDGEIYASEDVLIDYLEPCTETPSRVPFYVDAEGYPVLRKGERTEEEEADEVGSPSSGSKRGTRLGKLWESLKALNDRQRANRQSRWRGLKEFFKGLRRAL